MEEKSNMKIVKGGVKTSPEVKKLSYEDLENTAHQLSEQGRQLYVQNQKLSKALQEANLANFYERLNWLWKVMTATSEPNEIISHDFQVKCGKEFELLMTQPEPDTEEDTQDSKGE